jgi:carbon-monoxide dehydrogenase large subunit
MSQVIGIGASPRRKEDQRFLTGRGNYVADIKLPGMVAGVFVRSPHAHAKLKTIDAKPALARRITTRSTSPIPAGRTSRSSKSILIPAGLGSSTTSRSTTSAP